MVAHSVLHKILNSEYHLFPFRDKFILYTRSGKVLLLNKEAHQVIFWIKEKRSIEGVPISLLSGLGNILDYPTVEETRNKHQEWSPTALTVSLTNGCNLRCVYCYASAGSYKLQHLKQKVFETAVDLIANNASKTTKKRFQVNFLGNGESTFNWPLFLQSLLYVRSKGESLLSAMIHVTTNGVVSVEKVMKVTELVDSVTLSIDGLESHQTLLRPTISGTSSWNYVLRTAETLYASGIDWEIRMTITDQNVRDLASIVSFYSGRFPQVPIRFEPMHECGRSVGSNIAIPSTQDFLENFIEAEAVALSHGTRVSYSGIRKVATPTAISFCGIDTPNFCLKEDGSILACFTGNDRSLEYGHYDESATGFVVDREKIRLLQKLNVRNSKRCANCFAKYHCLGDCPSLRIKNPMVDTLTQYSQGEGRCEINQALVKRLILSSLGVHPTVSELTLKGGENA